MISGARILKGSLGYYPCYYLAEVCHVRLMADEQNENDTWVAFDADADTWLPTLCLVICAWEAALEPKFLAIFDTRPECWKIARADEAKRKESSVYNDWFEAGLHHVAHMTPIGKA
jgi:hypothetical protein